MVSEERFTLVEYDSRLSHCITVLLESQEVDEFRELRLVSCHELVHIDNAVG